MKNFIKFNLKEKSFAILADLLEETIYENYTKSKRKISIFDLFSPLDNLNILNKENIIEKDLKYYYFSLLNYYISFPKDIEILNFEEVDINFDRKNNNFDLKSNEYIYGYLVLNNKKVFILDLIKILNDIEKNIFDKINLKNESIENIEYSSIEILNKESDEKKLKKVENGDKMGKEIDREKSISENINNDKNDNNNTNYNNVNKDNFIKNDDNKLDNIEYEKSSEDEYYGTEEDKKRIYNEIEKIIDSLKTKDPEAKKIQYLKSSISFAKVLIFLYIILFSVSILAFGGFYFYVKKEEVRKKGEIAKIESIEAMLIKELKRKQEEEKKKLESLLSQIQEELDKVEKEKEEFLKNQDKILEEKQKKIYDEYIAKLEEQKRLLKSNAISKEEYEKAVSELNVNYNQQIESLKGEIERTKKEYLEKVAEVQKKLDKEKQDYQSKIEESEKNLEKTKSQISELQKKLEEEQKRSEEIEKQLEQMKVSSIEDLKIQQRISKYFIEFSNNIKDKNYDKSKKSLQDFKNYLITSSDSKKIDTEIKNYYLSLTDTFSNFIEKLLNEEELYNEKVKLLNLANDYFKNKKYDEAYNIYKKAFTNYFVISELDRQAIENFSSVSYIVMDKKEKSESEKEANILYQKIIDLNNQKNYQEALDLCKAFINNYSFSTKLNEIIKLAYDLQKNIEKINMDNEVVKLFRELNNLYEANDYNKAKLRAYDILLRYPGNSYSKQIIDILKKIDEKITESLKSASTQIITAQTLIEKKQFEILGRVIFYSEDTETLRIRIEKVGSIKVGDELKVYKVDKDNNYEVIAVVKVIEVIEDVVKAIVISKKENIVFGAIVSK